MALTLEQATLIDRIIMRSGHTNAPRRKGVQGGGLLTDAEEKIIEQIPLDELAKYGLLPPSKRVDPSKEIVDT